MAETVKDSIDIDATAEEIFEVATDFEAYPDWNPNIKKVEIRKTDSKGRATEVWFEVDAKVKKVQYTLKYSYTGAPKKFSWKLMDGDVKELSGSYEFDEFEDVTDVSYETSIDPGFKIPSMLKRQGERQLVRAALHDLKKRVESR
ncbi:MAG: SRPBCC family protein [Actinomycetota bacterium]|nr:SRPBCC family protein [Actinomycetota bacterium]